MFPINLRTILACLLAVVAVSCKTTSHAFERSLFKAYDYTAENQFTSNIEGPAVDNDGNLFVVNYQRDGTIAAVDKNGVCSVYVQLPPNSTGNSIQFNKEGNMLVADFTGHNILLVNTTTRVVSVFCHNDNFSQPNDICINRNGQVFASDPDWKNGTGKIWRIDVAGYPVIAKDQMGTTNGICLSPDGRTLYVNESVQRNVWAFDVDDKGDLGNKRLFTSFKDFGLDGMKCDINGNLYICRYGKGAIAIFNRDGRQIQEVPLKGKNVSNIVFGGWDFKTCFVTLQDRKCLEKFNSDVPGR